MTENIGLRLRHRNLFIVVLPTIGENFRIEVTDAIGRPPADENERREALKFLLRELSGLRTQVWKLLDEDVSR